MTEVFVVVYTSASGNAVSVYDSEQGAIARIHDLLRYECETWGEVPEYDYTARNAHWALWDAMESRGLSDGIEWAIYPKVVRG